MFNSESFFLGENDISLSISSDRTYVTLSSCGYSIGVPLGRGSVTGNSWGTNARYISGSAMEGVVPNFGRTWPSDLKNPNEYPTFHKWYETYNSTWRSYGTAEQRYQAMKASASLGTVHTKPRNYSLNGVVCNCPTEAEAALIWFARQRIAVLDPSYASYWNGFSTRIPMFWKGTTDTPCTNFSGYCQGGATFYGGGWADDAYTQYIYVAEFATP